ncbi:MAG: HypC/HybG/HupF family hydrogenase formation chaperone [Phycisphaerae bacterium]
MCLAIPARIVSRSEEAATVELGGNRLSIRTVLTPEAAPGDWVLVHAGFSIATIDEVEARRTWNYLRRSRWDETDEPDGAAEPRADAESSR